MFIHLLETMYGTRTTLCLLIPVHKAYIVPAFLVLYVVNRLTTIFTSRLTPQIFFFTPDAPWLIRLKM
jgi:hypothetical protein